jgi:hypothetical protein
MGEEYWDFDYKDQYEPGRIDRHKVGDIVLLNNGRFAKVIQTSGKSLQFIKTNEGLKAIGTKKRLPKK